MLVTLWLLLALALLLLNGFFVAAEFSMVKLRSTQIETIKNRYGMRGIILAKVHQQLDAYLSACQLGITLASLGLGWVGEPAMEALLVPLYGFFKLKSPDVMETITVVVGFGVLSFLHIVVGELVPKSLAIRRSDKIALWTALPLYFFYWIMYPAIWVLNACTNLILKNTNIDKGAKGEHYYSQEEIKIILRATRTQGELTKDEIEIIEHMFDFTDLIVPEVMRAKEEMIALDINQPIEKIIEKVMTHQYSRYPVYNKSMDQMVGILHVKDLFAAYYVKSEIKEIKSILRPLVKVSSELPAVELLGLFRKGKSHFCLVYHNEALIGFVTLDNLLHNLIGRIQDEFHLTHENWKKNTDGSISVAGECALYTLEKAIERSISVPDDSVATLMGLILFEVGHIPPENTELDFKEFKAIIEKVQGSRIAKIRIYPK